MAIDTYPGTDFAPIQPLLEVAPPVVVSDNIIPTPRISPEVDERARMVNDHRIMAAAAAAMGPYGSEVTAEAAAEVQSDVRAWIDSLPRTEAGPDVRSRVLGLAEYIKTAHAADVRLVALDATAAYLDMVQPPVESGMSPVELNDVTRLITEDMPVLHYVPEDRRHDLLVGLPDARVARLAPAPVAASAQASPAAPTVESDGKKERAPEFKLRDATEDDIAAMVDIDMRSFSKVYQEYGEDRDAMRSDLLAKFHNRFRLLGGKWMPVVTRRNESGEEQVCGFMIACPTSKRPEDFKSWEDTTDNGTLDTLYDADGKNMYIVTLSMDPSVKGERGQDQLYLRQVGNLLAEGIDMAFFESRMPGLKTWVRKQCRLAERDMSELTEDELMQFAQEYSILTKEVNGKQVPYDRLLRLYATDFVCKLIKVVPDAYRDEPSLNFGALFTFENPLPGWVRSSSILSKLAGGLLRLASRSTNVTRKALQSL